MNKNILQKIRSLKEKHSSDFIQKYGLTGIGVGHKKKNGKYTNIPALVFFVKKKLPKDQVSADLMIPST